MNGIQKNKIIYWALLVVFLIGAGFAPQPPDSIFLPLVDNGSALLEDPAGSTPLATLVPAATPTATIAPSATPTITSTPTTVPTPTATLRPTRTPRPTQTPLPTLSASDAILLAAGDIARCGSNGDVQTAAIIQKYPSAAVAPLGDNAYESGTSTEYATCYNPSWGAFKNRTYPSVGNHDYLTTGASGYFGYFGAAAGSPSKGYYSYNLGAWHIIVLNSYCSKAGGCTSSSAQGSWLKSDLAAHPTTCALAYWHHPYFSSGEWGDNTYMQPLVQILYNAGVEIMLAGHDHDYERFAPQDPSGNLDSSRGIVQFVSGTGGSNNTPWTVVQPNSLVRQNTSFGVLKLTLHASSYDWQFIPVSGSFKDSGTANCH